MQFLPEDYKSPTSNNYTKMQDGDNKFRILSRPVIGYEDWKDKKPYRFKEKPLKPFEEGKPARHFWAMIVWNYQEQAIQILQITQATIKETLHALSLDADWGAPYGYDIKITKKGSGKETSYMTMGLPHKPVADHIKEAFFAKRCSLDALFDNSDPFSALLVPTEGMFDQKVEKLDDDQLSTLQVLESNLDQESEKSFRDWVKKSFSAEALEDIPRDCFDKCVASLKAKIKYLKDQQKVVA